MAYGGISNTKDFISSDLEKFPSGGEHHCRYSDSRRQSWSVTAKLY